MTEVKYLLDLLRSDGSIIINKTLAQNIGLNNAIMFSELLSKYKYFADKDQLQDGYFFNTVENMQIDTTLTDHQQRKAIKALEKLGLIAYRTKGMPQKRFFNIIQDEEIIKKYLIPGNSNIQFLKNLRIKTKKNAELKLKKVQSNNTNSNNTKNNTKYINGDSFKKQKSHLPNNLNININLIDKELNNNKDKLINYDIKQIKEILIYYLNEYENTFNEQHPILKQEYWERVIEKLFINPDYYSPITTLDDKEDYINLIDKYLNTNFPSIDVDYNILHFIEPCVIENRFYETC